MYMVLLLALLMLVVPRGGVLAIKHNIKQATRSCTEVLCSKLPTHTLLRPTMLDMVVKLTVPQLRHGLKLGGINYEQ